MQLGEKEILRRLGAGESIATLCDAAGLSRKEFDAWWSACAASRVPDTRRTSREAVRGSVDIRRDEKGIPHISAQNDEDLWFGFGLSMAQDRLFQMDYLRRKASGRLSEVLGPEGLESDTIARTVGLRRIAEAEWHRLPEETQQLIRAYTAGVNAAITDSHDAPPIEFDLLGYECEPWSPVDCLAIEGEFRWYLTGRFPIIVMPELARRTLGDGPLYQEFITGEADDECIMPPGSSPSALAGRSEPVGATLGDPHDGVGSNNWVVSGSRTASGRPLLASDPHIAFEAVSCWYQAHLEGGSFHVAGMTYVGIPAIMFGRNERVAWGITNNICSQRDLFQEQTDSEHPGCFLYDGNWEPARQLEEVIHIKGSSPITKTIRFSRNGPLVDEILPPPGNNTGPVALKWLGAYQGGWLTALLGMGRARNAEEFREALRPWHVPTFSLVFADVDGNIGFQASGRIPIRKRPCRGYRPGWDPQYQWDGLVPFEAMPGLINPERGWMATANNRLVPDDYPYFLDGRWSNGYRARRIRQMIEDEQGLTRDDFRRLQHDTLSLRAVCLVPTLVALLKAQDDRRLQAAGRVLEAWDCRAEPDACGPTLFNVFFTLWTQTVAEQRFDPQTAELLAKGAEGAAARLLTADEAGWFPDHSLREQKILDAFRATLDLLTGRFGPNMNDWTWRKLHRMPLKHVLSSRGDLSELLDHGGDAVPGDMGTVCNTGCGPDWTATTGGGFRMIADLAGELPGTPAGLWTVDAQSQSGHPGSPHYRDQFPDWAAGKYHLLELSAVSSQRSEQ